MSRYAIHKAVEVSALAESKRPSDEDLNSIFYTWQPKIDGCNCVAVVNGGEVTLTSRTNETVHSAEHLKVELARLPSGVYLGEYCIPNEEFATISGKFRHTKEQFPEAQMFIFDVISLGEWGFGTSILWRHRASRLDAIPHFHHVSPLVPGTRVEAEKWIAEHPEYGCDGLIARHINGGWVKGSLGKGGEILKIKNIHSLDAVVTKIVTSKGTKTGRSVYVLQCKYKNQIISVGSGVPHNKEDLPEIGSLVEIEFLGWTKSFNLREPRYKGVRTDA